MNKAFLIALWCVGCLFLVMFVGSMVFKAATHKEPSTDKKPTSNTQPAIGVVQLNLCESDPGNADY